MADNISPLVVHARRELTLAGLFDEGSDFDGMIGDACMAMIEVFASQGHSGYSAAMVTDIVTMLMRFDVLSPLTDDPEEWMHITDDPKPTWQSTRKPEAFSHDQGKTYYEVGENLGLILETVHKE